MMEKGGAAPLTNNALNDMIFMTGMIVMVLVMLLMVTMLLVYGNNAGDGDANAGDEPLYH